MKQRRSLKEINADMDRINKQKPTEKQLDELSEVIKKNNEENDVSDSTIDPNKKIARSNDNLMME